MTEKTEGLFVKFKNIFSCGASPSPRHSARVQQASARQATTVHLPAMHLPMVVLLMRKAATDNGLDAAQAAVDEGFGAKTMVLQLVCQYTWTPVRAPDVIPPC